MLPCLFKSSSNPNRCQNHVNPCLLSSSLQSMDASFHLHKWRKLTPSMGMRWKTCITYQRVHHTEVGEMMLQASDHHVDNTLSVFFVVSKSSPHKAYHNLFWSALTVSASLREMPQRKAMEIKCLLANKKHPITHSLPQFLVSMWFIHAKESMWCNVTQWIPSTL